MTDNFEKIADDWIEDQLGSGHPVRKLVESLRAKLDYAVIEINKLCGWAGEPVGEECREIIKNLGTQTKAVTDTPALRSVLIRELPFLKAGIAKALKHVPETEMLERDVNRWASLTALEEALQTEKDSKA